MGPGFLTTIVNNQIVYHLVSQINNNAASVWSLLPSAGAVIQRDYVFGELVSSQHHLGNNEHTHTHTHTQVSWLNDNTCSSKKSGTFLNSRRIMKRLLDVTIFKNYEYNKSSTGRMTARWKQLHHLQWACDDDRITARRVWTRHEKALLAAEQLLRSSDCCGLGGGGASGANDPRRLGKKASRWIAGLFKKYIIFPPFMPRRPKTGGHPVARNLSIQLLSFFGWMGNLELTHTHTHTHKMALGDTQVAHALGAPSFSRILKWQTPTPFF